VGIPSLSIGIPTRNLRSGAEIVNEKDLDAAEKLLWHLV
jgi:putative aminopeptidase FrvX